MKFVKNGRKWLRVHSTEAMSYFFNSTKPIPSDQVRLLIFGQGRSGSTLLESLLCSTGYFRRNGELLSKARGHAILSPLKYIRGLSKMRSSENFISHVKVYQLTRDRKHPIDPAKFLNALSNDGWNVIYLRRRNKVRQSLSNLIREQRGAPHKFNDEKEEFTLSIDCDKFVSRVNGRFRFEEAEQEALANIKYHEVIYEDHLENPGSHQLTINRILDYVSLEHRAVTTNHRKINIQSLENLIVNYDEFVDCLIKQKWQGFLES
ncbi:MAG: hypothetical protein J7K09_07050 [Desulfuromusa sp.]|nr:hypothetical protein [Desulfuromusa sp.]